MGFKLNPITGKLDLVGSSSGGSSPENFSYELIDTGVTLEIPLNQQMIVQGVLTILGNLIPTGTLVII